MPLIRRSTVRMPRWGRSRTPFLDPTHGDPRVAAIREAAAAGQWPRVRELTADAALPSSPAEPAGSAGSAVPAGQAGTPDAAAAPDPAGGEELTWLAEGLMTVQGAETWLARAVAEGEDPALALLLSGARHVEWAWEARTHKPAHLVTDEQFAVFHERLRVAEEQLYQAAELAPHWAAPWYFLQITGRGLQVGQEVAGRRFAATVRRAPGHLAAHRQHLQQICRKWGGSHEAVHAFAHAAMTAAPAGSSLGELVAIGHLEQWFDEDEDHGYLSRPEVVLGLYEAAERSVHHPGYPRRRDWARAFNTFAYAFALAGETDASADLFRVLEGRVTSFPWSYHYGNPVSAFREWRSRVGA